MVVEYMNFTCPVCTSAFSLEKNAVRSDIFYCPVCQDGEVEKLAAEPEANLIAKALRGESGSWIILSAPVEMVSRS